jgi:hypothetical protein
VVQVSRRLDEVRTSSKLIYVNLDMRVLQSPLVSGDAVKLYGILADAINTHSHVGHISRDRMAVYLGKSVRTTERILGELVSHGIVTSKRRYNETSLYTVHHFDTLPDKVADSAAAAVERCDALKGVDLEVVPDLPETDTTDMAEAQDHRLTTDVTEAPTVPPDMAEASEAHDRSDGTVTTDLAHYQDDVTKTKNKNTSSADADGHGAEDDAPMLLGERPPTSTSDPRFAAFWAACPRKIGKADAFRKYQIAIRRGVASQVLLDGITRYAAACRGKDPQYIAHPSTWLHQGRWDDELTPTGTTGTSTIPEYAR